ncbi:hypothetical protein MBCUT_09360 [Methanobrevibacter cuticularis]|uniref:DUF4234 domain-containing protein n=1 Tax=Methanobrevibacter cuticularis TaxID=47311 RepID=A0A166E694_9EURY|nr:hypothetical protein [Methanobrevibacter cuticularis]KZX16323.1 hypothetical protein MBCUT_09360 [Methanobrevibacter cuticularis]
MEEKTKYCIYCGNEIPFDAKKCKYCYEWVDEDSISRNNAVNSYSSETIPDDNPDKNKYSTDENNRVSYPQYNNNVVEYSKIIPMRRFYLLMILTGGLYAYYWFYKNASHLRDYHGKDINVAFRTLCFIIVPIANWIVFYELLNDMKKPIKDKGLECYSPGLTLLGLILVGFIGFIFAPFIQLWFFINVQESFNEYWRLEEPNLPIRRSFSNGEIVVMILGIFLTIFLIIVYLSLLLGFMSAATGIPYY